VIRNARFHERDPGLGQYIVKRMRVASNAGGVGAPFDDVVLKS